MQQRFLVPALICWLYQEMIRNIRDNVQTHIDNVAITILKEHGLDLPHRLQSSTALHSNSNTTLLPPEVGEQSCPALSS